MVKSTNIQTKNKSTKVSDLTVAELKDLIKQTVQETLNEMRNDPDAGLEFKPEFVREVQESFNYVKGGGKTVPLKQFAKEHGLKA
jgi:hypothetical protein